MPDGAELLASSTPFGQQAMRYGQSAFAFQFHGEVTPAAFHRWQDSCEHLYPMPGAQTRELQDQLMAQHDPVQHRWFMQFLDEFLGDAIDASQAA